MTAVSGQYASAHDGSSCIAEVDRWSLVREAILHDYATCHTPGDGGMGVLAGRRRHTGTLSGIYDPDDPVEDYFEEGDRLPNLQLYVAAGKGYSGEAVIESLTIPEVDITEGAPIRWDAAFRAHGLFTRFGFS